MFIMIDGIKYHLPYDTERQMVVNMLLKDQGCCDPATFLEHYMRIPGKEQRLSRIANYPIKAKLNHIYESEKERFLISILHRLLMVIYSPSWVTINKEPGNPVLIVDITSYRRDKVTHVEYRLDELPEMLEGTPLASLVQSFWGSASTGDIAIAYSTKTSESTQGFIFDE